MPKIFGKDILVKKVSCSVLDVPGKPIEPSVNLFVKVTNCCNAKCKFCANAEQQHTARCFSVDKLKRVLSELRASDIIINRVNITGGEPAVVSPLVERILCLLDTPDFEDIHVHLNTNGLVPQSQELMKHQRFDSISMSLHHYDAGRLSELYGCKIAQEALLFDGIDMQKLNVSCNLVKGYIDNAEEARRMLDFVADLGVPRIGFVALMKVNDYCRKHFVDLESIDLESIPHVYFIKSMNRGENCKCSNYLYNKNLNVLEMYMRNYVNYKYCESSLVFDGEFLRQGFGSDSVIY